MSCGYRLRGKRLGCGIICWPTGLYHSANCIHHGTGLHCGWCRSCICQKSKCARNGFQEHGRRAVAGVVNTSEPDDPVVEPLVDCGFEPPISDVNTSITHSTKKFLSIVIVNSELTGKMNFKSHFCQKLIFKSAKVHNITKFPDFFLLNFRVCEPVHGSM